jgi:putative PIN family toxin of toxin-antitoxin system
MRIVLDTNILIRAGAKARGPARELLEIIVSWPEHRLVLSPFLLRELERVFSYLRVPKSSKLTSNEVAEYLSYLHSPEIVEMVFPGAAPRVVPSDPDDDPVVHTAVTGQANVLCTLNRHFFHPKVIEYCGDRGVLIMRDLDLLDALRTSSDAEEFNGKSGHEL